MSEKFTIGVVAKKANVSVETIRYYQRRGLIPVPETPYSGFRTYPPEIVTRLNFIKGAQKLGFTLSEIADLLKLGTDDCAKTREISEKKLKLVQSKIKDLEAMARVLKDLINSCYSNIPQSGCPIISALLKN